MERLTGLDAAFLSLESPTTHLHILGALIFDPTAVPGGVDFGRIRDLVADRVHLVPPFRKRPLEVPFGLQQASMADDPEFDIDYHVRRASLPAPGGREELEALVADLASRPLDRRRPLWEFHVVEGVDGGRIALVPKVHHAIIDGVSGAEVMAAFFDLSADPSPRPLFGAGRRRPRSGRVQVEGRGRGPRGSTQDPAEPAQAGPSWSPDPLPGEADLWRDVLASMPGHAEAVARTLGRTVQILRGLNSRNRVEGGTVPPAPFAAPRTSINRAISAHRRVAFAELPLGDVRRVREVLGGTANDVVLAATAGAMHEFFAGRGEQPESPLVALVPVSVRAESERGTLGNRVSAMLVSLADGIEEPASRLACIRDEVAAAKEQSRSIGPEVFAGWAQTTFPAVATRLSRLVTNLRLFDHVAPMFNLIVSNVPGPDVPLYLAGARMVAMFPLGPIIEGVGINVTVFSYLDTMYVGVQGCWDLVPDVSVIAQGMEDSLASLVVEANRRDRPVPWWHAELPA
ncbi:MAG: wax ester/triacylglycerol synthase family O-acyltransferase [Acidimicrobiales bacterium]|jgi:WS/DGAT/MGAT family acyltransferase